MTVYSVTNPFRWESQFKEKQSSEQQLSSTFGTASKMVVTFSFTGKTETQISFTLVLYLHACTPAFSRKMFANSVKEQCLPKHYYQSYYYIIFFCPKMGYLLALPLSTIDLLTGDGGLLIHLENYNSVLPLVINCCELSCACVAIL